MEKPDTKIVTDAEPIRCPKCGRSTVFGATKLVNGERVCEHCVALVKGTKE